MMAVYRQSWGSDYTVIPNSIFRNERLSLRDIGLLCLMLSQPADWEFSVRGLSKCLPCDGADAVKTSVEALRKAGYVKGTQERKGGKFGRGSFDVLDSPCTAEPCADKPCTGKPFTGEPPTAEPFTGKRQQQSNIEQSNITKKEGVKKTSEFVPPSVLEVQAYCQAQGYTINPETFVNYYEANGWVQGKARKPLRDWKAAVRGWNSRERPQQKQEAKTAFAWAIPDISDFSV